MSDIRVFSTSNAGDLLEHVTDDLGLTKGELHTERFSDGEVFVNFKESIRGKSIIIIARTNIPYSNLFELFLTIDAAKRASAKEIIAVVPYMPHSRQERKDTERTSIASRVIADFLEQAGADRLMTIDLHSYTIEGFFKIPVDHLNTTNLFSKYIKQLNLDNLLLCSPDFGGLKRVKQYKKHLECDLAVIHKERLIPNQVASMEVIGDVAGKNVVIIDDIVDTAGTLCTAADLLIEKGAVSVRAFCTHGLLSGNAKEKITKSKLEKLYTLDTIVRDQPFDKVEVLSCAPLISKAIKNLLENRSIKELNESY